MLGGPQLIFPFKTWFFGIYFNFQQQKSLNPAHQNLFNSTERHIPVPAKFLAII
jgi:hypothetical protein